jgi:hypothetical protein
MLRFSEYFSSDSIKRVVKSDSSVVADTGRKRKILNIKII